MNLKSLRWLGAFLVVLSLGSCSKEQAQPQVEEVHYTQKTVSLQLEASVEPFAEQAEKVNNGRSVTYDLVTEGNLKMVPKFKGLSDGTKLLCIIRSSTPGQPVNYIQAEWKRQGNRYYIQHVDGEHTFQYDTSKPLGTLHAMLIAGGQWNASTKQLSFTSSVVSPTTDGTKQSATLDVPYFSDWQELEITSSRTDALKLKLKNYKAGLAQEPAFTLKPQGMLLRMRVENEMLDPANPTVFRHIALKKIYIRSTAYAGNGYYDLSEAAVRAGVSKAAGIRNEQLLPWVFSDTKSLKLTELTMPGGSLDLPGDATSTTRGSTRGLKDYPNSPWILVWVKPTGQTTSQISENGGDFGVRTEILADVSDVRTNTVYSNTPGVDAEEAKGKIVVPSMQALPAYASRKLAVKNNADVAFSNGGTYSLTLNLQRMPMGFDRLSEYEVADDGASFTDASYNNVGYFSHEQTVNPIPLTQSGKWEYPSFGTLATFMGRTSGVDGYGITTSTTDETIYPKVKTDVGNYQPYQSIARSGIAFSSKVTDGTFDEIQTMMFYPEADAWGKVSDKTAAYTSIVRYQYEGLRNGIPTMKMTQRYLGSYSLWAAQFPEATAPASYRSLMGKDLKHIVDAGEAFWNDELLKKDDVVRYFPLLGYKLHTAELARKGEQGSILIKKGLSTSENGFGLFSRTFLKHTPGGDINHPGTGGSQYPLRLVRTSLSFK
jgi:lipoprotein